jgi:hypothetical protein
MLPFRSKYVSRLAPLAVLGAIALVPAAASATVTSTTVTSPTSKTNIMQLNSGGPLALADLVTATGTAPGASDGDLVQIVCDHDGGSTTLPFPIVVNNQQWTTASILPFGLPLGLGALDNSPGSGDDGSMCNIRAIPFGTDPINRTPFAPNAVGIGRIDTFDNGGLSGSPLKNYEAVSNQSGGMYQITSAGDDGVTDSHKFYGSNFAERADGVFEEVASFGQDNLPLALLPSFGLTNEGDSSIGISNVDGSNPTSGLLPSNQFGAPLSILNTSDISVQRTVDAATGNSTIKESSRARECHVALVFCVDYDDAGLKLDRTVSTSADGVTATITDTWTNTSGVSHRYDMRYYNRVGDAGDTGIGVNGGVPMQKSAGDSFLPGTSGPWSMVINSDTSNPDSGDSDDHGAITYMNAPDIVLMEDSDEFQSWYQRTLAPGGSYQVKQVLNQTGTVAEAQSAATAAQSAPAAVSTPSAPATLSASGARQQQAISNAVANQSAGQGRSRYTASARIAKSKVTGKRYIRLQVSGAPGTVKIKVALLNKQGKKVGKAAKITVATNRKLNIRSLSVPASARKVLVSAL